jgi:hypothetical protein
MTDSDILNIYDEIEIDDMDFEEGKFYYPCPCGDKFQITMVQTSLNLIPYRSRYLMERTSRLALVALCRLR